MYNNNNSNLIKIYKNISELLQQNCGKCTCNNCCGLVFILFHTCYVFKIFFFFNFSFCLVFALPFGCYKLFSCFSGKERVKASVGKSGKMNDRS